MILVERIERPRIEGGVDWSNSRIVLARYGNKELLWMRSGKHWADMLSGYVPHGGELYLVDNTRRRCDRGYMGLDRKKLEEGGRISRARVRLHAREIDAFFGVRGVARSVRISATLLIE